MKRNERSSTVAASFWSFLEQCGVKVINLAVQIVLARLLAPKAFGVLAILLVVINVADAVAQSGMGSALVQRSDVNADSYTTAFWLSEAVAAAMYIVIFFAASTISAFYGMPDLVKYLRVMGLVLITNSANSIQRAYLQKNMDFKTLFRTNTFAALGSGAVGVACAIVGLGVWALVLQTMSLSIFACLALLKYVPWKPTLSFRRDQARSLFSYGWAMAATGIINVIYSGISELILGRTVSSGQLGLYSQGRKWPTAAISAGSNAIQNVMFPALAERKDNPEEFRHAMRRALVVGTYVMAPLSMCIAAMGEPLVLLLLGDKWHACVPVFQATCVANFPMMLMLVNLRAYMALGDSRLYFRINIIKIAIGTIAIGGTALATGDIYAVAYVTAAYTVLTVFFVDMVPAKRKTGLGWTEQMRLVLPTLVLSLGSTIATLFIGRLALGTVAMLAAQMICFGAIYLGGSSTLHLEGYAEIKSILAGRLHRKA